MTYTTYSQRILNPFHGMLQVVRMKGAVAESTDGINWTIYVMDERIVTHSGLSEVRYGRWSRANGLTRNKLRLTTSLDLIRNRGEQLVDHLQDCSGQTPFDPMDHYEFWLLDTAGLPLALLDTAIRQSACNESPGTHWSPGATAQASFDSEHGNAQELTSLITKSAGRQPRGRWFDRRTNRDYKFADLFIRDEWPTDWQRGIVADYIGWQAPWLLQWPLLNDDDRARLESAAWNRPIEVEKAHHLYPKVLDHAGLTAARVRSRFIEEAVGDPLDRSLLPFFNE